MISYDFPVVHFGIFVIFGFWLMAHTHRQATGPPRSGAGVGDGMLRGAGDSLT